MLLKFAYDGTKFYGYQRQVDLPTVEGEILKVLKKYEISNEIKSASRTDRGVSALGNVIKVSTDEDPDKVIGILNSNLHHIFFRGYSMNEANPRFAKLRWYRYHLPDFGYSIQDLRESAKIFQGEHDFRNFTKAKKNTVLNIEEIKVEKRNGIYIIDFRARYYLWNMIRRIVAAMSSYASGNYFDENVFEKRVNFGVAPPEPLILMDVIYDFPFTMRKLRPREKNWFFKRFSAGLVYYYLFEE